MNSYLKYCFITALAKTLCVNCGPSLNFIFKVTSNQNQKGAIKMLTSPYKLLEDAKKKNYAVAAFNFYNLDTLFATLDAAKEENAPVIVQLYYKDFENLRGSSIAVAALEAIKSTPIPVALHLDHANQFEHVIQAMGCGFNSVMIDASSLPLEENIEITKKVVDIAHILGIFTEAELGQIFRAGDFSDGEIGDQKADPKAALRLVQETGVDSLAPAVGTAHGIYKAEPNIDFGRIKEINDMVKVPLVLHGGSGIPDEKIKLAISNGIRKINFGTELKHTWSATMKKGLDEGEKEIRILSVKAKEAVKEIAKSKIRLFGSSNKA